MTDLLIVSLAPQEGVYTPVGSDFAQFANEQLSEMASHESAFADVLRGWATAGDFSRQIHGRLGPRANAVAEASQSMVSAPLDVLAQQSATTFAGLDSDLVDLDAATDAAARFVPDLPTPENIAVPTEVVPISLPPPVLPPPAPPPAPGPQTLPPAAPPEPGRVFFPEPLPFPCIQTPSFDIPFAPSPLPGISLPGRGPCGPRVPFGCELSIFGIPMGGCVTLGGGFPGGGGGGGGHLEDFLQLF